MLFDKYTLSRERGSKVFTVDIDPNATKTCRSVVSENVEINTGDSVKYLIELMKIFKSEKKVSLFYLDCMMLIGNHHINQQLTILKN